MDIDLFEGAKNGIWAKVLDGLRRNPDVNRVDANGLTAMMLACRKGRTETAVALAGLGANKDQKDKHMMTALMWACAYGHTDTAVALARVGANIHLENKYGCTALMMACRNGYLETTIALARLGANLHLRDKNGKTARDLAIEGGHVEIVKLLDSHEVLAYMRSPLEEVVAPETMLSLKGKAAAYDAAVVDAEVTEVIVEAQEATKSKTFMKVKEVEAKPAAGSTVTAEVLEVLGTKGTTEAAVEASLINPSALSIAGNEAGRQALAWTGARGCLATCAAIYVLRISLRTEAEAKEVSRAALLCAALSRAREAESKWRKATSTATATAAEASSLCPSHFPALLLSRATAAAAARTALAEAEACVSAAAELNSDGADADAGSEQIATAAEMLRAVLMEHGDQKWEMSTSEQQNPVATAEAALAGWLAEHGGAVVEAVEGQGAAGGWNGGYAHRLSAACPALFEVAHAWLAAAAWRAASAQAAAASGVGAGASRGELLAQELAWLGASAAAVAAQEEDAAVCERERLALGQAFEGRKASKTAAIRARAEVRVKEEGGEEVAPEEYARAKALEEEAAFLERRIEGCLDNLRRLSKQGLPEASAVLATHPAAQPAPPQRGKEESPLEFHFRALVREGVAQPGRGREDYVDVQSLLHARGNVFTARLRGGSERCVLKRFAAQGTAADGVEVFLNELRVLRSLDEHPNIIALECAVWDKASGDVFLQFPYIEGGALPQWLASAPRAWHARLRLFRGIIQGLAYLHSKKVVHRDVKPGNVLVSADGTAKIADFGISHAQESALHAALPTTVLGRGAGTVQYKSPEQLRGERASTASDVYSAGLLLVELLSGAPLKQSEEARREGQPAPLPAARASSSGDSDIGCEIVRRMLDVPEANVEGVELALALLRRLLSPAPSNRPTANAVLADPLFDSSGQGAQAGGLVELSVDGVGSFEATVVRRLSCLALPQRNVLVDVASGPAAAFDGTSAALAGLLGSGPAELLALERADRQRATGGAAPDTERLLDGFLTGCLVPERGLFEASGEEQATVLPCSGPLDKPRLELMKAFGAALAQAALGGLPVDIAERLPPVFYLVLIEGPESLLSASLSTLLSLLAAWDSTLAAQFRSLLLGPIAGMCGLELRGVSSLSQELTEANKEDLLRRACAARLLGDRVAAWAAVRSGFAGPAAGGGQVLAAVTAASGPSLPVQAAALRSVIHGTSVRSRRERQRKADDVASLKEVQQGSTRCPHCAIPVHRAEACFHMKCRCGGQFYDCCGRPYPDPAHPSNYRCPFTSKTL